MLPIYLKYSNKNELKYVDASLSVSQLMQKISSELSIDQSSMKLLFAGKVLDPTKNLLSYDIQKECCINIIGSIVEKLQTIPKNVDILENKEYVYYVSYTFTSKDNLKPTVNFNNVSKKNKKLINNKDSNSLLLVTKNQEQELFIVMSKPFRSHSIQSKITTIKLSDIGKSTKLINYGNTSLVLKIYKSAILFQKQNDDINSMIRKKTINEKTIKYVTLCQQHEINIKYILSIDDNLYKNPIIINTIHRLFGEFKTYKKGDILHFSNMKKLLKRDIDGLFSKLISTIDDGCYAYIRDMDNKYKLNILLLSLEYKYVSEIDKKILSRIECNSCSMPMNYARSYNGNLYCNTCLDKKINEIALINPKDIDILIKKIASNKLVAKLSEMISFDKDKIQSIECVGCKQIFSYEGTFDISLHPKKDILGNDLSDMELIHHYNENRIKCNLCSIEFCKECKTINYHTGFTCEQYNTYLKSDKCKFCMGPVTNNSCKKLACKEYEKLCSKYTLDCGHANYGFDKYDLCLDCLEMKNEDCYICMSEKLSTMPCIKMDCGHVFHKECMEEKFRLKHSTKYITMNYVNCPVCYYRLSHELFDNKIIDIQKDNLMIEQLTMEYIKDYNLKIPVKDMIEKLRFYRCNDCSNIYIGGEAVCREDIEDQDKNQNNLCNNCNSIGKQSCNKHGTEYLIFKCGYCCENPAVYKCYGTTHFCKPCHDYAGSIEPKPCPGGELCIIGGNHPTNTGKGFHHAIGCSMCLPTDFLNKIKWKYAGRSY